MKPIIFKGEMVRAILDRRKTQTRRALAVQPCALRDFNRGNLSIRMRGGLYQAFNPKCPPIQCPFGSLGDQIWVKENHRYHDWTEDGKPFIEYQADGQALLREVAEKDAAGVQEIWADLSDPENFDIDNRAADRKWRPSIHMPRWASRITLQIKRVRIERLQDISEADAQAEGCADVDYSQGRTYVDAYRSLWGSISGPESWDANPWVWAIDFEPVGGET